MNQIIQAILDKQERYQGEINELIQYFSDLSFISMVQATANESVIQQLFSDIKLEHFKKNQVVFNEGDASNGNMYVIVRGKIGIAIMKSINLFEDVSDTTTKHGDIKRVLIKGDHFGEKAIIEKAGYRMASAIVLEDCSLLLIGRMKYLMIKDNMEEEQKIIKQIMLQVIPETNKISSPKIIDQLAYTFTYVHFKMGDTMVHDGSLGYKQIINNISDFLYILTEGDCEVSKKIVFKMKQRKPILLDYIPDQIKLFSPTQTKTKFNKLFTDGKKQETESNQNSKLKQVDRGIYIKVSQTSQYDLLGMEILFENEHQRHLFKKFKMVQDHIGPDRQLTLNQIQNIVKRWVTDAQVHSNSPYIYRVKVTSLKAKCLRLRKSDFLMRFPKESVEKTQLNYLMKIFQRFMITECQQQDIQDRIEEQDKKSWLIPGKEVICLKSESIYIKSLYTDYLLKKNDQPQNSDRKDSQTDLTLNKKSSLPSLRSSFCGEVREVQESSNAYKKYRIPSTFDFGNESIKAVEMNIQYELSNRGLLEKMKKISHRVDISQDVQKALKSKVMQKKNQDIKSINEFAYLVNVQHHPTVHYNINKSISPPKKDHSSLRLIKQPQAFITENMMQFPIKKQLQRKFKVLY